LGFSILHMASGRRWWCGVLRHISDLARGQQRSGHRVTIACIKGSILEEKAKESGIRVINLVMSNRWEVSQFPSFLMRLGPGFDVVHVHLDEDYIVPASAARLRRVPAVVMTRHHLVEFRSRFSAFVCSEVMYDALIAVSSSVRATLLRGGVAAERIFQVNNGIDLEHFRFDVQARERIRRELGIPNAAPVVCAAGRLVADKGFSALLRATRRVVESGTALYAVILGRGSGQQTLFQLAQELCIEPYIRFPGLRLDINRFYSAADFVAAPSLSEAFGYTAAEALACGRPVVASSGGGLEETITEDCGILVPPNDEVALASALERLASDSRERQRLASNARKRAECFGLDSMVQGVESVYSTVLTRKFPQRYPQGDV